MSGFDRVALAFGFAIVLATPVTLHASTCGAVEWSMVPGPMSVAPRNARVWLTIPATWRTTGLCRRGEGVSCRSNAFSLALRTTEGREVAAVIEETRGDQDRVVTIGGKEPLPARERFEVWLVGEGGHERDRILGTFRTSDEIDNAPPTWTRRARVVAAFGMERAKPTVQQKGVITLSDMLGVEGPYLALDVDRPDDGPSAAVGLRVRTVAPGDPSDGSTAIVPLSRELGSVTLGGTIAGCTYSTVALPRRQTRIKLVVEAIDLAGNATAPIELAVPMPR